MVNVSIVLYKHTVADIEPLVNTLRKSTEVSEVYVLDNSPIQDESFNALAVNYIFTGKNLGYGAAHNIALRRSMESRVKYHLVVNPDIRFEADIIDIIARFMDKNAETGHLMPKVFYPDGQIQYLCKLIPTPVDLLFRRFLPAGWTRRPTAQFEMHGSGYNRIMDVPYLSGCFMFLRVTALEETGIFDERFFMYPEDIDLTRRIHRKYRTVFYPEVSVVHYHERSSYKNLKMLWIHTVNLIRYFNKWGWICDKERRIINTQIKKQYT
jgi:GT2 family glycosyltransferase